MEIVTGCPFDCGGSCPLKVEVAGGEVLRLAPYEDVPDTPEKPQLRPCAKGLSQVQRIYHPDRLRYPLKRVGKKGEAKFERISWEEALDTVAGRMKQIKQQYGLQAILNLSGAANTDGLLHRTGVMARRFFNTWGGSTASRGIISFEGALFACRHTFGLIAAPPEPESLLHSRLIIMWGLNPSESIFGTNNNYYLALAKERGARFIFVDPRFTDSAAALADQWIPIIPGADTAMLIAMAAVMIQEGLYDEGFLGKYTCGFEKFRDYCLGVTDGVPKTPFWAEAFCGVKAEVIARLAREYAASKSANLMGGWSPGRTAFGEQFHRACITLAAMTGNIGKMGGGPGCWISRNFNHALGVSTMPVLDNPIGKSIVSWRWADAVLEGTEGGYPSDIKMIFSVGGNRLNQCADINKGIQALKKVEFVVALDNFLAPMAKYADIVLPAASHFEREDIQVPHNAGEYLIYNNKATRPFHEARTDLEILTELAKRLGNDSFNDRLEQEWLKEFMRESKIDTEILRQKGVCRGEPPFTEEPLGKFIDDPTKSPLPTPSGKIEIFSEALSQRKLSQLPPVPQHIPDRDNSDLSIVTKYPLLLITTHSRLRVNSTFDNVPWLRELEPHTLWINPSDAESRGIKNGQEIKVHNDIGTMMIKAKVTERIMPGVVSIYQGAWYQPDGKGVDRGGSVNVLCKDTLSPGEAAATNAIRVEVAGVR